VRCISGYTKLTVSLITLVLTIFIMSGVNQAYESLQSNINRTNENICEETSILMQEICEPNEDERIEQNLSKITNLEKKTWQIEITKIDLIAPIKQGTTQEVMKEYVGHFENTNFWSGNIGLAAHNRRFSNKLF